MVVKVQFKMNKTTDGNIILPSNNIEIGHCVILNDVEKPCGELVAVIVAIDNETAHCKYLNADPRLNPYNKKHGMAILLKNGLHNLTPINKFGIQVCYNSKMKKYYCERVGESIATYSDGKLRQWQENIPIFYPARSEIIKITKSKYN